MSVKAAPDERDLPFDLDGARTLPPPSGEHERVSLGSGASLRTRDHAAIVYWTSAELFDSVVPYLCAGLRAGDQVVYVADDHSVEAVSEALRAAGIDVGAEVSAERLILTQARAAFFPAGCFDVERALDGVRALAASAAARGFERVRLSVEMTYLLADVPGIERGAEFEARANEEIFSEHPFVCICSFNAAREDPSEVITDVLATHPVLIASGIPLVNPHYRSWELLAADRSARARWAGRAPLDAEE